MQKRKNNKGFSLIELVIAIAILVILTGLLAPQFMKYLERARRAKMMQKLDTIYSVLSTSYVDVLEEGDDKNNDGVESIIVNWGKVATPLEDVVDHLLVEKMVAVLGDEEMKNITFVVNREYTIDINGNKETMDAYSLKNLTIRYSSETGKIAKDAHYYYYNKGAFTISGGMYGEVVNGVTEQWK